VQGDQLLWEFMTFGEGGKQVWDKRTLMCGEVARTEDETRFARSLLGSAVGIFGSDCTNLAD
jgi:hypothetical protein